MFPWKKDLSSTQRNFNSVPNTHEYIIIHHTGTPKGTLAGNIKILTGRHPDGTPYESANPVSAHALVDWNGDAYKLGKSEQSLWHAGKSCWGNLVWLNYHSIGIEIIGPTDEDFTNEQRGAVKALIGHFMAVYNIPPENVLRHKDLTWAWSGKKRLYDGTSPSRKPDVHDSLWKNFKSWDEYRRSIVPKAL